MPPGPALWPMVVERLNCLAPTTRSGQSCISVQRILVHRDHHDAGESSSRPRSGKLKAGDPRDEATFIGPVIDEDAARRIDGWIDAADRRWRDRAGARQTSRQHAPCRPPARHPARRRPGSAKEAFGPVAWRPSTISTMRWRGSTTTTSACRPACSPAASPTPCAPGNRLEVGGVVVGDVPSFRVDNMPYGGVRHSGLGRKACAGRSTT